MGRYAMTPDEFNRVLAFYSESVQHDLKKWIVWFCDQPGVDTTPRSMVADWYSKVRELDTIYVVTAIERIIDGKIEPLSWYDNYSTGSFLRRIGLEVKREDEKRQRRIALLEQVASEGDYDAEAKEDFRQIKERLRNETGRL